MRGHGGRGHGASLPPHGEAHPVLRSTVSDPWTVPPGGSPPLPERAASMAVGSTREPLPRGFPDQPPAYHRVDLRSTAPPELVGGLRLLSLSPREATVYLALGRLGPTEASRIAQSVGLHRATTYRVVTRLVRRGLVAGDGRRPQRYVSIPPDVVLRRLGGFLREGEEVALAMGEIYARWGHWPPPSDPSERVWLVPPRLPGTAPSAPHPVLALLGRGQHHLDGVVPASVVGPRYRAGLVSALLRLARSGAHVRVITDASLSGRRLEAALRRESVVGTGSLEARHFTPCGAHYYLLDGRLLLRFPALPRTGPFLETAVATDEPHRARVQSVRFEALWAEAVAAPGRRSRRSRAVAGPARDSNRPLRLISSLPRVA